MDSPAGFTFPCIVAVVAPIGLASIVQISGIPGEGEALADGEIDGDSGNSDPGPVDKSFQVLGNNILLTTAQEEFIFKR